MSEESQHYFITPPTMFLPPDGLRVTVIGTDDEWTDLLGDVLEGTMPNMPMTFYHLDKATADQWQWLYHMSESSNLIMVNVSKTTQLELTLAMSYSSENKIWFYVDPDQVDMNLIMLLNTMNANVFSSSDQLVSMLRAYIGNE